jgi:hypothetical protein
MAISAEGLALEDLHVGPRGKPTLGPAFELFRTQWQSGERDRELALHLMFLAWYLCIEPPFLTGLDTASNSDGELASMFNAVHDWLLPAGADTHDAEALFVAGLAARLVPWVLGDEPSWTARSEAYRTRYRQLVPDGLSPAVFEGRSAYGEYFAGQARVIGGY